MKIAKTILNSFVAVVLLVATTGMTLNKHYCMGRLKSVAINETASPCIDETGLPIEMPCCQDITEELKVEEVTQPNFEFDSEADLYEISAILWVLMDLSPTEVQSNFPSNHYSPPPPDIDFQVAHQVFLI